ncbi:DMT family transporter [Altererythrobacter sp.]|nr:DMT family transporter [Altererythrobacter sp.]
MDGSIARPRPLLALGLRLLTALSLATMAMLVKVAGERGVHLLELIFWRQAFTCLVVAAFLGLTGKLIQIRTKRLGAHGRRAVYGLTGMVFVYGAVMLLPLAEATTISFTTPLFAVLIALILFREKIGMYRWGAVLVGFAGVAIAMQPGANSGISVAGIAVGLVAALMVAIISFQVQDLNQTETPFGIVFWFTALTTPLAAMAMPFVAAGHDPATYAIIAAMAVCATAAQLLLTASLRFGSAATIIVMDYTALIWATAYGWTVFDRVPPTSLWLGAPLIILSGLIIAWREHRSRPV